MTRTTEFQRVTGSSFVWSKYDPQVKADLSATAWNTVNGWILVDPFSTEAAGLAVEIGDSPVAGVVITNANHKRDAAVFAQEFSVPLYVHPDALLDLALANAKEIISGGRLAPDVTVVGVDGAVTGEIAVHCEAD